MRRLLLSSLLALLATAPARATLIIGAPIAAANFFPFQTTGIPVYQQVYSASNFSDPIAITGLTFYTLPNFPTTIATAKYRIELSTTSAPVNGLSDTFADNKGPDNAVVFDGMLSGPAGPSFTIPTGVFNYAPSLGNLLLTVTKSDATSSGFGAFAARNGTFPLFSRKYSSSNPTTADNSGAENGWGLVTGFETAVVATPEPGAIALVASSLPIGLVCWLRRRKAVAA